MVIPWISPKTPIKIDVSRESRELLKGGVDVTNLKILLAEFTRSTNPSSIVFTKNIFKKTVDKQPGGGGNNVPQRRICIQ